MIIEFFVPGVPATAGSKVGIPIYKGKGEDRAFTGKVAMRDSCKKKTTWMADVKHTAYQAYSGEPLIGPLKLDVIFYMPRPQNHYGTGRNAGILKDWAPEYCDKRPDRGKLLRAVEDALTGWLWKDDSQVCDGPVVKKYVSYEESQQPGAKIRIETL